MKQIYIPPFISILIVAAIGMGVTVYILHVISQMNALQLQAAQEAGL